MSLNPVSHRLQRFWYSDSISAFLESDASSIIGELALHCGYSLLHTQTHAWEWEIELLQSQLPGLEGTVFFEFNIPRMGRRIDVVLVVKSLVFVIEFKVGEAKFDRAALEQVWDYALDLKNFHQTSHAAVILPVLIATESKSNAIPRLERDQDDLYRPVCIAPSHFRFLIDMALGADPGQRIDPGDWSSGAYLPTPTILEAARALYARHSVESIARNDAGAKNLHATTARIDDLIEDARSRHRKIICFVTGVPGAGKTLVGLNVATQHRVENEPTHAVFLSGNVPLVAVLREALIRDEIARRKLAGRKITKKFAGESVKAFIQNVHHYRDEALIDERPPIDHVAIFDEAQRAWNLEQTRRFMITKKKCKDFTFSEPEFLMAYMDRHPDWAVVVCLVGGGQEINTGEAGIGAWIEAVTNKFSNWDMYISPNLADSEYSAVRAFESVLSHHRIYWDEKLHLSVSMRSFRAENVSSFIKAVLDKDQEGAREHLSVLSARYPIRLTRNLDRAKAWIRRQARGSERYGLVASSKAMRLKPHAIDVRVKVDPVCYFLNDRTDTRSSYYLEDGATEFQVQGLELDWVCVTWDGDFRSSESSQMGWSFHDFRGDHWQNIHKEDRRHYTLNAYRVLLTRARQGMVIFVPPGDTEDHTRQPAFYNETYQYLRSVGIEEV